MEVLHHREILGVRVHWTSYADSTDRVLSWARAGESRYVCVADVHSVIEACDSQEYRALMNAADLVTPDGMPLVWCLWMLGARPASRVYGPDLMLCVLEAAAREQIPLGFYGGTPDVLAAMLKLVRKRFSRAPIAYACAPPFLPMDWADQLRVVDEINDSGTRILFVGLGCPRQELWMARHRGRLDAVMLGVGAAFDFITGMKPQAPRWMMRAGFEWLFRLVTEPRRLWRRYLRQNPRFIVLAAKQLIGLRAMRES
jgi:N-acetylglucosaminyldiphosphoundecaprenol N-acetyl-beta-D-mannosaminyltransferase